MGKFLDKVAVIIGGASGIGAATAQLFIKHGVKVVLVDVNEEKGNAFAEELRKRNGEVVFVQANGTSEEEMQNVFKIAVGTFGRVDIVFNKAVIGRISYPKKLSYDAWRKTINVA